MLVGVAAAALVACGGGTSRTDEAVAEIYSAAVRWLVEDADGLTRGAHTRVFVESVTEDPIDLEVQAGVIERLEGFAAVRFIDARAEAVDVSKPGDPARDRGWLVGLGSVRGVDRPPVRVYADRYRDVQQVRAYQLVVERRAGRWIVSDRSQRVAVDPDRRAGRARTGRALSDAVL